MKNLNIKIQPESRKENYASDQEVRWCPGCGDYAILASMQKVLPDLGIDKENMVFISGIGCSSRFPYYLDTYGFHTIHGRAPTIATGLKIARPELSVWVITGDGDGLSIGANHLLHLMRRNIDVTVLLFNNRIYGLTKGQYSPTSEKGKKTKTTPLGSLDHPFDPVSLALAAGCSFVARGIDVDSHRLQWILREASLHKGTSFVEIYQNCNVFNDGAFSDISDRGNRENSTVTLAPGEPLIFAEGSKGIAYNGQELEIIDMQELHAQERVYVHRDLESIPLAMKLNELQYPDFPVPIGIFRQVARPSYEDELQAQIEQGKKKKGSLKDLLHAGKTWDI